MLSSCAPRPPRVPPAQGAAKRLRAAERRLDRALEAALGDGDWGGMDDFDALEAPEQPQRGEDGRLPAAAWHTLPGGCKAAELEQSRIPPQHLTCRL